MSRTIRRALSKPVAVGAAIIAVAAVAVVAVVVAAAPRDAHRPQTVTAHFEDAVGLYEGNSVAVLGMPVGTVTSVVPKDSYVEVTLTVDKDVDIPADVNAVTISTSILTDRHIELTPVYRGGPKLKNGDVLGLGRTRTPVEFDRTLAMIDKLARSLGGDDKGQGPLADLVGIGNQIASRSGSDIKAALDQLSQALHLGDDNGAVTKKNIQAIANSLAQLTQSAADNDTAIREFGSDIRILSDIVADEDLGAGTTGKKLNQILDQATSLLETNREGLKQTVADFHILTTAVDDNRRGLMETLDLLPMMADNMYNAIDQNAGAIRAHALLDKTFLQGQITKEICNLAAIKDMGCATGTIADYGPAYGAEFFVDSMTGLLERMAGTTK